MVYINQYELLFFLRTALKPFGTQPLALSQSINFLKKHNNRKKYHPNTQTTAPVKGAIILGDTFNLFHGLTPTHWLGKGHQ